MLSKKKLCFCIAKCWPKVDSANAGGVSITPLWPALLWAAVQGWGCWVSRVGTPLAQACCNPAPVEVRGDALRAAP